MVIEACYFAATSFESRTRSCFSVKNMAFSTFSAEWPSPNSEHINFPSPNPLQNLIFFLIAPLLSRWHRFINFILPNRKSLTLPKRSSWKRDKHFAKLWEPNRGAQRPQLGAPTWKSEDRLSLTARNQKLPRYPSNSSLCELNHI